MMKRKDALEKENCIASQLLKMRDAHGKPISARLMQVGSHVAQPRARQNAVSKGCKRRGRERWRAGSKEHRGKQG